MELKPYRILVAVPRALDEALATVPLIRALKTVRCDMQVNIVCRLPSWGYGRRCRKLPMCCRTTP